MNNLSIRKMNELTKKKRKGFTLVELIIVIAIIAILAAMAIPKLGAMRSSARVSNDVAAAKNIATIASNLVSDGTIPIGASDTTIDLSDAASTSATKIKGKLDGRVASSGKTEATGTAFSVIVKTDGGIQVKVGTNELYPDSTGSGRTGYAGTVS